MNADIKKRWVKALRSGRYAQARHALRTDQGFCCLGVLCDIVKKDVKKSWQEGASEMGMDGYKEYLPPVIAKFVGLHRSSQAFLATKNDDGRSFGEIADLIDQRY